MFVYKNEKQKIIVIENSVKELIETIFNSPAGPGVNPANIEETSPGLYKVEYMTYVSFDSYGDYIDYETGGKCTTEAHTFSVAPAVLYYDDVVWLVDVLVFNPFLEQKMKFRLFCQSTPVYDLKTLFLIFPGIKQAYEKYGKNHGLYSNALRKYANNQGAV